MSYPDKQPAVKGLISDRVRGLGLPTLKVGLYDKINAYPTGTYLHLWSHSLD